MKFIFTRLNQMILHLKCFKLTGYISFVKQNGTRPKARYIIYDCHSILLLKYRLCTVIPWPKDVLHNLEHF